MILTLQRAGQGKNSTLSRLYIGGEFCCFGLEDLVREEKIRGSTAIPAGNYRLGLNTYGAMNARYKRRFPDIHQGMLEIMAIPNFSYVYIHIGNYYSDTSGCLLVGDYYKFPHCQDYAVFDSTKAYKRLYQQILPDVKAGNVMLEILDI